MSASVVIPCFNGWSLTHALLMNIYRYFPPDAEVIVVDDCSTDKEVSTGLSWWKESLLKGRLTVYVNEANCGFLRTSNFGVSKATNDIVFLISNDVQISSKNVHDKICKELETTEGILVGARLLDMDTGWNRFGDRIFPYLEGWLLAFHKSDWLSLGGFDERYRPYDFEDVDISTTFLAKGGKLVGVDVDAVHLGAQTYKYSPEREAQTKRNQKKFEEKWVTKSKS